MAEDPRPGGRLGLKFRPRGQAQADPFRPRFRGGGGVLPLLTNLPMFVAIDTVRYTLPQVGGDFVPSEEAPLFLIS